jgi:hypothetical protein
MTAPKHFHGLVPENNHNGIFEYMAHEFMVRTKAIPLPKKTKKEKQKFRGFSSRSDLITAYKNAKLSYYNGTLVPDADWDAGLVPKKFVDNRNIKLSVPLGRTIESLTSVPIKKEFRIETEKVDWTLPAGSFPSDEPGRLAKLRASIAADTRFATNHAWPMWERRGFTNFNDYWNGHHWTVNNVDRAGDLLCVGRRFDYTIIQPIVDRSVAPPTPRPLIYNFYPGTGSAQQPLLNGLVESDNRFFGRA